MSSRLVPFLGSRHAHFYVAITFHELLNVPLLTGEFAVAWNLSHSIASTSHLESGDLVGEVESLFSGASDDATVGSSSGTPPNSGAVPGQQSTSSKPAGETAGLMLSPIRTGDGRFQRKRSGSDTSATASHPAVQNAAATVEPKGESSFQPVDRHTVRWERKAEAGVRVGIDRPTAAVIEEGAKAASAQDTLKAGFLHKAPIKIAVRQSLKKGGPTSTLGVLKLNLAEYAPAPRADGSGTPAAMTRSETRQYLLDQSPSNALLRITIEMRFIGGSHSYRVPPMQHGIPGLARILEPSAGGEAGLTSEMPQGLESSFWIRGQPEEPGGAGLPRIGLEWHSHMPLSISQYQRAIPPELLRQRERDRDREREQDHGPILLNSLNVRPVAAEMQVDSVIQELFRGLPGGPEGPNYGLQSPAESQQDSQSNLERASSLARSRWRKLKHAIELGRNSNTMSHRRTPSSPLSGGRRDISRTWSHSSSDQGSIRSGGVFPLQMTSLPSEPGSAGRPPSVNRGGAATDSPRVSEEGSLPPRSPR